MVCHTEVDRFHSAAHEGQFMPEPRPPVSRTNCAHHSLCGSERAHLSRDSKSCQYWRMPPWGGTTEKIMFSCKSSPSGCSATDLAILGPKRSSVLSPLSLLTRIPR